MVKLDELKDELGKLDELKDEFGKLDELDELLSYWMSWVSCVS